MKEIKEREKWIQAYEKTSLEMEHALQLDPKNPRLRKVLYLIKKAMGRIALGGRNYLVAQMSFEGWQAFGYGAEGAKWVKILKKARVNAKNNDCKRIGQIMDSLQKGTMPQGMMGEYVDEILHMKGIHVIQTLLPYLNRKNQSQMLLAIEILGKLRDNQSLIKDKRVGKYLLEKLQKINLNDRELVETLIWALGRLRETKALSVINKISWIKDMGENFRDRISLPLRWLSFHIKKNSLPLDQLAQRARIKLNQKKYKDSIRLFSQVLSSSQKIPFSQKIFSYAHRGFAKGYVQDFSGAMEDYKKALELAPNMPNIYNFRGITKKIQMDFSGALADFTKAISLKADFTGALVNRGLVYMRMKKYSRAMADFQKTLTYTNRLALAYSCIGQIYFFRGELVKAEKNFNRAIRLEPRSWNVYRFMGDLWFRRKKIHRAIENYSRAIRINPRFGRAYYSRGFSRMQIGVYRGALEDFEMVLRLYPNFPDGKKIRIWMGRCRKFIKKQK